MNVIIANKNRDLFSNLDIEILKNNYGEISSDQIINLYANMFYKKIFIDITSIINYQDLKEIQKLALNLDANKIVLLLENNDICRSSLFQSKLVNMGIYNFTFDLDGLKYLSEHTNVYRDVAHLQDVNRFESPEVTEIITPDGEKNAFILGFKNVTSHAGATTLIYLLKQQLSKFYKVVAIEINRRDFKYFNDDNMISIRENQLEDTLKNYDNNEIIILDLNDCNYELNCNDVLYLIEPSILKLNKMIDINGNIFQKLYNKKIILNMSLLNDKDIHDFEKESNSTVFYNLSPLNDRLNNSDELLHLLEKMNFISQKGEEKNQDNRVKRIFKF